MLVLILFSLTPIIFWAMAQQSIFTSFSDSYSTLKSLGQLSGLIGITMFSINIILSARLKIIEKVLPLNLAYLNHHTLGGIAFILLMFHPLLLLSSRLFISLDYAKDLITPGLELPIDIGTIALLWMMILLILTFWRKIPYELWRLTHKFLGVVFIISLLHVIITPSDVSTYPPLGIYIYTISLVAIISYLYRTVFFKFLVKRHTYKIKAVNKLKENIIEITLIHNDHRHNPIEYLPGQFVFIEFLDPKYANEIHPFSIASAPSPEIVILSKVEGDFTKKLMDVEINIEAKVEGPYGKFTYSNYQQKRQIWIAGGIGIAAFMGMVKDLKLKDKYDIDFYYCTRNELEHLEINKKLIKFHSICSEKTGHITAQSIIENSTNWENAEYFICGPKNMMRDIRLGLNQNGIRHSKIHTEEFSLD